MKGKHITTRIFAALTAFLLIFTTHTLRVLADTIRTSEGEMLEVTTDGTFIYMDYEGPWSNYLGTQISVGVNGAPANGAMSGIVLNTGNGEESGSFQVYNAWGAPINGAEGRIQNLNPRPGYGYERMKWSVMIPISVYGGEGISEITFDWKGQRTGVSLNHDNIPDTDSEKESTGSQDKDGQDESGENKEDGSGENKEDGAGEGNGSNEEISGMPMNPPVVTSGLAIDGYYADWAGYPKTQITYLSNNTKSVHIGQMAVDGDRLYAHFAMNDLYTSQMRIQIWNLQINGNTYPLQILPVTGSGEIDWQNSETKWKEGTHEGFDVFVGYYPSCEGKVAFTVYDEAHSAEGKGDEIEFSISLDRLSEITGVPVDQMSSIKLSNPNIGGESVEISGTPTGPWLGAFTALLIASGCFAKRRKEEKGLS